MCLMKGQSAFQEDILTVHLVIKQEINNCEIWYAWYTYNLSQTQKKHKPYK